MNYQQIKEILIEKYPNSTPELIDLYLDICSISDNGKFVEKHHILPRHAFPKYEKFSDNPWNMVKLSGANHFIAHYWFAKIAETWGAWNTVANLSSMNNGLHEARNWSKADLAKFSVMVGEARKRRREIGLSETHRSNIGKGVKGTKRSLSARANMSAARIGMKFTDSHCENISISKIGTIREDWEKDKISSTMSGVKKSKTHASNIRAGKRTSSVWNEKYKELHEYWSHLTSCGKDIGYCKFARLCNEQGIFNGPASQLNSLVRHFNKVSLGKEELHNPVA